MADQYNKTNSTTQILVRNLDEDAVIDIPVVDEEHVDTVWTEVEW